MDVKIALCEKSHRAIWSQFYSTNEHTIPLEPAVSFLKLDIHTNNKSVLKRFSSPQCRFAGYANPITAAPDSFSNRGDACCRLSGLPPWQKYHNPHWGRCNSAVPHSSNSRKGYRQKLKSVSALRLVACPMFTLHCGIQCSFVKVQGYMFMLLQN